MNRLLVAALVVLAGIGAMAVLSGRYQIRPVLSGSMRPGLPVGGVFVTQRVPVSDIHVRDVVVFHPPGEPQNLVVHRIISLKPGPSGPVVQTQGDANNIPDPWAMTLAGASAYRVLFALPLVGYLAVWMHGPTGHLALMLVGVLLIVGTAARAIVILRRPQIRPRSRGRSTPSAEGAAATLLPAEKLPTVTTG